MDIKELVELVEEYTCGTQPRYRFRVKDTNIVINIEAGSREDAWNKVVELFEKLEIGKIIDEIRRRYRERLQRYIRE